LSTKRLKIDHQQRSARPKGQSLAEYGLVLALVSVVSLSSLKLLGDSLQNQFVSLVGALGQASSGLAVTAPPGINPTTPASTSGTSNHTTPTSAANNSSSLTGTDTGTAPASTTPTGTASNTPIQADTSINPVPISTKLTPTANNPNSAETGSTTDNYPVPSSTGTSTAPATSATAQNGCSGSGEGCLTQSNIGW
jgi:Flp pilus assembly pilin Flp